MTPPVPRVFIIRHGETEWSLSGKHTGTTDIPLTSNGERRIRATGRALVGNDRLILPRNLAAVFVSPRKRAQRTFQLLLEESIGLGGEQPGDVEATLQRAREVEAIQGIVETRQDIREWDYGDYEGKKTSEIVDERKREGKGPWSIWSEGCPGGESPEQITARLDKLIAEIRSRFHQPMLNHLHTSPGAKCPPSDVLIVAHGHILRALAARWVGRSIADNPSLILEAGGVGTLSYEHWNINEPAILLGGAFVVDVVEEIESKNQA